MMRSPKKKGNTKADVKKHCDRTFGIGSKAFVRAWDEAVHHKDTFDWSLPGAPKSGNSNPPVTNAKNS